MLGILRVLSMDSVTAINQHGDRISARYGIPVRSAAIADQPDGIHDLETEALAEPKLLQLATELRDSGCEALGISCFADPAVAKIRAALGIPVIGAGTAATTMAMSLPGKVGILTILRDIPGHLTDLLGKAYCGFALPEGVTTSNDLKSPDAWAASLDAVADLKKRGASTIILGCTGYTTIDFAAAAATELDVRVIDPIDALGAAAAAIVR